MKKPIRMLGAVAAVASVSFAVLAADHGDAPVAADPAADLTDLYAFMTGAARVNLILTVTPDAGNGAWFSDAVTYAFHVNSMDEYGDANPTETVIRCVFPDATNIECWAGNDYVFGDASGESGIISDNAGMRVFAGLRDDPFFLEYVGFTATVDAALAAVAAEEVEFDDDGCPLLSQEQGTALRTQLTQGANGADASNTFAGQNVLALVIQIDRSIVAPGGRLLGVWASTYSN
jgi:hypothetical protein